MGEAARAAFLSAHAALAARQGVDDEETEELRRRAAAALDECTRAGAALQASEVDVRLYRPPWRSQRVVVTPLNARTLDSVEQSRARLLKRHPQAAGLIGFLDCRAAALEPYRRLGDSRHQPWAEASVAATVAAVGWARTRASVNTAPVCVLVADGSLGAEASAAAAAGGRVIVCEPNRFAAAAIRQVAAQHGMDHAVRVVSSSLEEHVARGGPDSHADVVVLAPLLEEAALGRRLLPSAAATAAAATVAYCSGERPPNGRPLLVPATVTVRGALCVLSAGVVHGVDLTPLDVTRWTPYPMPMSVLREEGGAQLSAYESLLRFDLGECDGIHNAGDALRGCERTVAFTVSAAMVESANQTVGADGQRGWARCNAVMLDVAPGFASDRSGEGGGSAAAASPPLRDPQKRAVHLLEPFMVRAGEVVRLTVRHDGLRIAISPPASAPVAAFGPRDGWGAMLLQHWHFAMLRDAPRNDAYAVAIQRAARRLSRSLTAQQAARFGERAAEGPSVGAVDLGSGSGLLALLLARQLTQRGGGGLGGLGGGGGSLVLGVEIVDGVVDLGRRCIAHNGAAGRVELVRAEGHALCARFAQGPPENAPRAPLLVAELMDSGGCGEGLLPLAYDAIRSGLVDRAAQMLPSRLRVWAFAAELRRCGTALDGAEIVGAHVCGVSLAPWLRYHEMRAYASVDLPNAEYTPLTDEALLFDAKLGEPPPGDAALAVAAIASGTANAVVWTWEVDLDETTSLSNAPRAPKTHWRQAVHLLDEGALPVQAGQPLALSYRSISNGRELRFSLAANARAVRDAGRPSRTRPHAAKSWHAAPTEPPTDGATTLRLPAAAEASSLATCTAVRSATGGSAQAGRSAQRRQWRARRLRAPVPPITPVAIDTAWKQAMAKATSNAVQDFGLSPRGAQHSMQLCEAALEIAAHPARYGVHPADALQAVRLYYAS